MKTGEWLGAYAVEIDEQGEEVVSLEGEWRLPANYFAREAELAAENIAAGHPRAELAISRAALFAGVQLFRERCDDPVWGEKFLKDPRPFSSVRKEES